MPAIVWHVARGTSAKSAALDTTEEIAASCNLQPATSRVHNLRMLAMRLARWAKRLVAAGADDAVEPALAAQTHSELGIAALAEERFDDAVIAFREAVQLDPASAKHHVNLAYALQKSDAAPGALRHLKQAADLDSSLFDAQYMLGGALERDGDEPGAIEHLRRAVELDPGFEPARIDLCRLLAASGDLRAAREAIETALSLTPGNADFHYYLGNVSMAAEEPEAAITNYRHALTLQPEHQQVHANLGLALHARHDYDAAVESFDRAIALAPDDSAVYAHKAITLRSQGHFDKAVDSLERATQLQPDNEIAFNLLGTVLLDQGRVEPAIESFRKATQLAPELPGGYANLGLALFEKGDVAQAVCNYRRALEIKPLAEVHDNLGIALIKQGHADDAIHHFEAALCLQPDNIGTRVNLAAALADGAADPALGIAALHEILAIKPDHLVAHSNLLFNLSFADRTSAEDYLAEARRYDAKLPRDLLPPLPAPVSIPGKPLRVGFVSGDLYGHPVGFFLEGVLRHLDPARFALFAYATSPREDALSSRIKPLFKRWQTLTGLSHESAARLIRADSIDILIDLSGHTGANRLPMFSMRPAPLQVSWLGYFASTGVREMDYILVDRHCVPVGTEHQLSEKPWHLPDTRLCYTAPADPSTPEIAVLPALANGYITFGCFQRFQKIGDRVLALWSQVLKALPTSRLMLQGHQTATPVFMDRMAVRLAGFGISRDRIVFNPPSGRDAYMRSYALVDIVLDTFPYNGGTTTCEALWMGVPTLTIRGDTMLARQGAALLTAAGMSDWIAENEAAFVEKAIGAAADVSTLTKLRASLRESVRTSPLFDSERFAGHFGDALSAMWQERTVVAPSSSSHKAAT